MAGAVERRQAVRKVQRLASKPHKGNWTVHGCDLQLGHLSKVFFPPNTHAPGWPQDTPLSHPLCVHSTSHESTQPSSGHLALVTILVCSTWYHLTPEPTILTYSGTPFSANGTALPLICCHTPAARYHREGAGCTAHP